MNKAWTYIVTAFGIVTGFFTLDSWYSSNYGGNSFIARLFSAQSSETYAFVQFFLSDIKVVALAVFYFVSVNLRIWLGGEAGPIGILRFLRLFNPYCYLKAMRAIHEFHHEIYQTTDNARKTTNKSLDNRTFRKDLLSLQEHVKSCIDSITGADTSVHIKVCSDTRLEISPEEAQYVSIERAASRREIKLEKKGKLDCRRTGDKEPFKIMVGDEGKPGNLISLKESVKYATNSAYNYIFHTKHHYWINNSLPRSEKKLNFFSSSKSYRKYYKSLAVCLLCHPMPKGVDIKGIKATPLGILHIDSYKQHRFDEYFVKHLMAYFAHRLYDFVDTWDNYTKNNLASAPIKIKK